MRVRFQRDIVVFNHDISLNMQTYILI